MGSIYYNLKKKRVWYLKKGCWGQSIPRKQRTQSCGSNSLLTVYNIPYNDSNFKRIYEFKIEKAESDIT